jgi:hypothetical protein
MKQIVIAVSALLVAASAYAQGTINFVTRVTGVVDVKAMYNGAPADATFWGQLYYAPANSTDPSAFKAVGAPTAFRSPPSTLAGYITAGGTVTIPDIAGGSPAAVQVRAWAANINGATPTTYEAAAALGQGGTGLSAIIPALVLGNAGSPPTPAANLAGLGIGTTLDIQTIVPEPSIAALGLLGAGLLLIRRKK